MTVLGSTGKLPVTSFTRVDRSIEDARANYSSLSKWYDLTQGWFERYFVNLGLKLLDIKENDHVLDIGCGTGFAMRKIATEATDGSVLGIDLSEKMIQVAREKSKQLDDKICRRMRFTNANILTETLDNSRYSKIFMGFVLELFTAKQMEVLLNKCHKTIAEGGKMVILGLYRPKSRSLGVKIYEYLHHLFPVMIDCRPIPVDHILEATGWQLRRRRVLSMWGLPVIILEAFSLKKLR